MKTNYIKQAWASLRQQPMLSSVSIIGTALAIFLIMIVVMIGQLETAPFAPESNRDRWLVSKFGTITNDKWGNDNSSNGPYGYNTVKQVLYRMETPEAVSAFETNPSTASVAVPNESAFGAMLLNTDAGFWNVFDFTFINGNPYTQEEFESGITKAVISESLARKLFKSTDVVGRHFSIDHSDYTVSGVVEDVSNVVSYCYADLWVPFTSTNVGDFSWCEYMGSLSMVMLAKDKKDFGEIRAEYERLFDDLNREAGERGWNFKLMDRPYTQEVAANTPWANLPPDMPAVYREKFIIFLILLIVPAVNLSSMTHSRLARRREEIGVRRAFGAHRSEIVRDLFIECLIITIIAGLIGLLLSLIGGLLFADKIFTPSIFSANYKVTSISIRHLFHWSTFAWAMLFCFILNVPSAALPSINASRVNIVNALSGKK